MNICSLAVGRSLMALLVASSVIGIPVPASATGERGGQLTVDGRPLFGPVSLTTGTTDGPMHRLLARAASGSPAGGLLKPGSVDAGPLTRAALLTRSQPTPARNRSWVKRHPVLVGTLVGAVAGAGIVHASVGAEAAFVGFYGGAAVGSVVGLLASR